MTLDLFNVIYTGSIGEMEWGGGCICTTGRNKHHMTVHSMYFMQNYVMNVYNILKVIWPKSSRWSLASLRRIFVFKEKITIFMKVSTFFEPNSFTWRHGFLYTDVEIILAITSHRFCSTSICRTHSDVRWTFLLSWLYEDN